MHPGSDPPSTGHGHGATHRLDRSARLIRSSVPDYGPGDGVDAPSRRLVTVGIEPSLPTPVTSQCTGSSLWNQTTRRLIYRPQLVGATASAPGSPCTGRHRSTPSTARSARSAAQWRHERLTGQPELVGVLYRSTSVPEIPSTWAKRLAVVASIGIFVLAVVLAVVS